jgi:hypothetical protein
MCYPKKAECSVFTHFPDKVYFQIPDHSQGRYTASQIQIYGFLSLGFALHSQAPGSKSDATGHESDAILAVSDPNFYTFDFQPVIRPLQTPPTKLIFGGFFWYNQVHVLVVLQYQYNCTTTAVLLLKYHNCGTNGIERDWNPSTSVAIEL